MLSSMNRWVCLCVGAQNGSNAQSHLLDASSVQGQPAAASRLLKFDVSPQNLQPELAVLQT